LTFTSLPLVTPAPVSERGSVAGMLALLLALALPVSAGASQVLGVHPSLQKSYVPSNKNTWKCLDGSKEIPFTSVNDDFCDCPDGTDEPGTSACLNSTFYCVNQGHIGASIPSSRVNDGLCEVECCDGSDEASGVCPNRCKEIGEEYNKRVALENKTRKTGAKIRSTYIAYAQKEKTKLEKELASLDLQIAAQENIVAKLRDIKDHSESLSLADMEVKRQSPVYQSLQIHKNALKSYRRLYTQMKERDRTLSEIMNSLREGYNPNYQDMAVLEAVRGWEAIEGLPHIGTDEEPPKQETSEEEEVEEGAWTEDQLEHQLDGLIEQDYLSLLLSHESYLETTGGSPLMEISSYLPDSWLPVYVSIRTGLLQILHTVGIVTGSASREKSEQAAAALQGFNDAESELSRLHRQKGDTTKTLGELFDPKHFGAQGEWKKLENTCLERESGDYIYEVCMFGSATQKAKNGANHNLGHFTSWNKESNVGDPDYYSVQYYTGGAQCWNGPQRSVTLELKCGTENVLHVVSEPEKCEYHITGETPALCLPLEVQGPGPKEDL